jgi:hypothetical protein
MQATKPPISPAGEQVTKTYGRYQITAQQTVDGGYAINTFTATGGTRHDELCITTADRFAYRLIYAVIRDGGHNNVDPDGVRQAVRDALTRDLWDMDRRREPSCQTRIPELERLVDAFTPAAELAEVDALAADINASLGRSPVRTLADTVPAGRKPQVAPSRSKVERKPLTGPQVRIISAHQGGIIRAGNGVSWVSLQSIARKGYADVIHRAPSGRILAVRLNKDGYANVKAVA